MAKQLHGLQILQLSTESGDHYGPFVFDEELTEDELEDFLREEFPDEWLDDNGPGFRGSYIYADWSDS